MMFDGVIDIATGFGANSKTWKNKQIKWSDLVEKLSVSHKTTETLKEFLSATKTEQCKIKDVGGYVGGYLRGGRRKPENVLHRQLLTLDIDYAHVFFWDDFCLQFGNAALLHGTHKHHDESPRYRLIMPLARECTPDEYVAISRKVAGTLGIELFDKTTFETSRLMFWPSSPKDVDYYCQMQDGEFIDPDAVLASYVDWTDSSAWPTAEREKNETRANVKKQEDPCEKKGVIGAFCRTYSISEAISTFLVDKYVLTDIENRYTYTQGSTAAGLIVYEDKFAYSHHGTDPCGGKLCNAFDLVRIHLYGHLDSEDAPKNSKPKSFAAMELLARSDKRVKGTIAEEVVKQSKYDFAEDLDEERPEEPASLDWMKELEVDSKGSYLSSSTNLNLVFANDSRLHKLFRQNDFDGKRYAFASLPWRKLTKPEPVKNVDYSGIRNYIESVYGIASSAKVEDSLALEFEKNHFHPVTDYLNSLEWDGVRRLDTLLIDLFGAVDNIYTREAVRKMMCGAVARVFNPGVKFDLVLTLVSQAQGTGKSSFLKAIGRAWFSDTFLTVQGKEAFEQLQGAWIIEMAELSGLKKGDIETIKHFISKQEDSFRPAYARTSETFARQCVFVATTNESTFLRDPSGNRRFMPVDIHNKALTENEKLKGFLTDEGAVDQVWAEAVHLYKNGEKLYLSFEAEAIATVEQKKHSETDERKGLIESYLNRVLPANWDKMDIYDRRNFLDGNETPENGLSKDAVCVAEIWCECLGKAKEDMDRYKTREINDILRSIDGWSHVNSTKNFKLYGKQKYYARSLD